MTIELDAWPSPKERAIEMIEKSSGSKNMAVWLQEEIVKYLSDRYQIKSKYEKEVLKELKKIKLWHLKKH